MRLLTTALIVFLATPALAAIDDTNAPVLAVTPSGEGDPDAITCRAPQPLPAGGMGPKVCMHNNVWARLTMTGQDLSADGKSVMARPTVMTPSGAGNPDAVTCRRPAQFTASRTKQGPEVCLTNAHWKKLAAEEKRIDNNGNVVSTKIYGPGGAGHDGIPITSAEISPAL
ncbi:MAG: hypothetical protein U1E93_10775 [Alphaproteobacteria bacterium]